MKTVRTFTKTGQPARGQRWREHVIRTNSSGGVAITAQDGRLSIHFTDETNAEWTQHFSEAETRQIKIALESAGGRPL